MNIICCGAGTVGMQAAEALVAAGHNVTVIDLKAERLRALGDGLDVKTFHGSCAHADVLAEAGAKGADMVLASTNVDEVNLLTAGVGKALGAKMTVARVHGSAFFEHRNLDYRRLLGIDHLICPEYSTAMAIASFLRNPGAICIESFADNKIHMQQFEVGACAVGATLARLPLPPGLRLAAITRRGSAFVPKADTAIEKDDVVTLVGNTDVFADGRKLLAGGAPRPQNVVMMGGTSIAVWLCRALVEDDFEIRLFEQDRERAEKLASRLDGVTIFNADPTDPAVFEEERLGAADVFIGLLGDDEHNILACAWAKNKGVRQVVAVVQRPNYLYLLEPVGIDHAVSPRLAVVREIERLIAAGRLRRAAALAEGSIDVYEVHVGTACAVADKPLREIQLAPDMVIAAIQHGAETFVPGAGDCVHAGDRLLVVGARGMERTLQRLFAAE
ncbi:MAG TPA: Trk system potassium transporter TrkA [Planctomycetes bacterium]|nr:Trk system potassium transporter TrkA [Planctomycetota bacterium]